MKLALLFLMLWGSLHGRDIFVSPSGNDRNAGTRARPVRTWQAAKSLARRSRGASERMTVWFRAGVYYLPETMVFGPEDSGVTHAAVEGEEVVISGGERLALRWTAWQGGVYSAPVPNAFETDQLFVNGQRQPMARFPNFDAGILPFNGWSADSFGRERAARWANPAGGYIHAMHKHLWGDYHYRITGKDASGNVVYEGGWQNNRQLGMHDKFRFVENIFEELDAPGEWFLDRVAHRIYYWPPSGVDLKTAVVEAVRLRHLVEFRGTEQNPVHDVHLRGLTFRHAARTFMENREPLLRSDWTTYRGGAIFITGSVDCTLEELVVDQVGGNAIFVNNYNRRLAIRRTHILNAGANGIAFVGDPDAVRSPLFEYAQRQKVSDIDRTPGPKTNNYPSDCIVDDSLIHGTGRVEKQTAPIQISMAQSITVRQCSIYDVPRAGINISEGTWGGHLIEGCDVFDTVKETGDHGSFNSWGRDRYWGLADVDVKALGAGEFADLPLLDAVKTTVIRNNRWRCDHGWDIDLDDGSTNYHIHDNLTLKGGIKLREGFHRVVENNVIANNSFHPHVWYPNSQDVFRRNIVFSEYKPIRVPAPWGKEIDFNLLHRPDKAEAEPALALRKQSGRDEHSVWVDARVGPNYQIAADSPAVALGFRPFATDRYGVRWAKLKSLARTPDLSGPSRSGSATTSTKRDGKTAVWLGATVRNLLGLGEVSATGVAGEQGVIVLEVPGQSRAAAVGLQMGDVILEIDGKPALSLPMLLELSAAAPRFGKVRVGVWRSQSRLALLLDAPLQ